MCLNVVIAVQHNISNLGGTGQPGRVGLGQPSQVSQAQTFTGNVMNGPTASVTGDMHRVPTPPIPTAPQTTPSSMAPASAQVKYNTAHSIAGFSW